MNVPEPSFNLVCFGEILWDILPEGAQPGGAPMNVAYHLKQLGQRPAMISRIGQDDWGKKMQQVLTEKDILQQYVQIDDTYPTGTVDAIPNEHQEMQYVFAKPVAWDMIVPEQEAASIVAKADYFVFGSLVNRMDTSKNTLMQLLDLARTRVLDINLRPPHYSQSLVETLLQRADLLKMNESELAIISNWYGPYHRIEDQLNALLDRYRLTTLLVTMGGNGALVHTGGQIYQHPGYPVKVADTIGSGDSFLAAYLSQTIDGASPAEALAFACAVGALMASKVGGCPVYEPSEAAQLQNR